MAKILAYFLLSILALNVSADMGPSDQPIEYFSSLPISNYRLSPSGDKVGYFVPNNGRRTLVVHQLDGTNRRIEPPWDDKIELVNFFWKTEDVVVFQVHMTIKRREFVQKTTETRLISYDMSANEVHWLGQPKRLAFGRSDEYFNSQNEVVVDRLLDDPDHILIQLDFELDGYPSVYRANVKKGTRKEVHRQRTGTNSWYTDPDGTVRLGYGFRVRGSKGMFRYLNSKGDWQDLPNLKILETHDLIDLGPETGQVYMTGENEHGTNSMYLVDLLNGEVIETLFSHAEVDINTTVRHPATDKVVGVSYTDDFNRIEYFDQDLKRIQRSLQKALPDMVVEITDKARDANLYLVLAYNDTDPGQFFLFDRDNKRLDYFASYREEIDPLLSGPTQAVAIPVTDGSNIPGYLTLPAGVEAKSLPTVLLPHGGPSARDSADWDFMAQFFASRGYAVLKPNFRGSTGYGKAFHKQGEQQWGGLMQQDLTDATNWLVREGISDPKRICIVGASYGGYAAMMGLIQHPDLYACGVSVNGVMNIPAIKSADRNVIGGRSWIKSVGLEGSDDADVSPYQQAERISDPVLLVAAKNDARISYKQTKNFHKRLKKLKKDTTYVEMETGTHYMLNRESREITLKAAEKFLTVHLN